MEAMYKSVKVGGGVNGSSWEGLNGVETGAVFGPKIIYRVGFCLFERLAVWSNGRRFLANLMVSGSGLSDFDSLARVPVLVILTASGIGLACFKLKLCRVSVSWTEKSRKIFRTHFRRSHNNNNFLFLDTASAEVQSKFARLQNSPKIYIGPTCILKIAWGSASQPDFVGHQSTRL